MKKSLVMVMVMAMGVTASAYAANPFTDVPAGHWAYDSISQLEAAGIVDGYGATFGGEKLMTRYEMAQIVAKAMAKGANCDKLVAEFATELDALGVRVAKLEKKVDNVKITGNIRYSYRDTNTGKGGHVANKGKGYNSKSYNRFRTRLWVDGRVNDNWKYTGMLEQNRFFHTASDFGDGDKLNLAQAYVTGRIGGLKVRGGRVYFKDVTNADNNADGIEVVYGNVNDVKVTGWVFKNFGSAKMHVSENDDDRYYRLMLEKKFEKLDVAAAYWKVDVSHNDVVGVVGNDTEIYNLKLAYPIANDLKLSAEYLHGKATQDDMDKNGFYAELAYRGAKASVPGTWGLYAAYTERPYSTIIQPSTLSVWAQYPGQAELGTGYDAGLDTDGYKGWEFGASYTFAKNIVGDVKYADYEARQGTTKNARTMWADIMFMF